MDMNEQESLVTSTRDVNSDKMVCDSFDLISCLYTCSDLIRLMSILSLYLMVLLVSHVLDFCLN